MNGSWEVYLASPLDFTGADDAITNLAKERQPGIEITESLIITNYKYNSPVSLSCNF